METENTVAVIISIIAIIFSLVAVGGLFYNQPEDVDLNGIVDNTLLITALQGDVETLQGDIYDITCNCDIDEDDLDDLEDDLKKYARDRAGEDGEDGKDADEFELKCETFFVETINNTHVYNTTCKII